MILLIGIKSLALQTYMTTLQISQLLPEPLQDADLSGSSVWQSEIFFQEHEYVKVEAPSGRGKSTFINIIFGNRMDYSGTVKINNKNIRDFGLNDWSAYRRKNLSVVFQDLRLLPELTGLENLQLKAKLISYYDTAKLKEMAARLGVEKLLHKKAKLMSYGERQRFAIIRSLTQPFDWLLLDEPFSHLDKNNISKASALILEECEKRSAGILHCGLDADSLIPYKKKLAL